MAPSTTDGWAEALEGWRGLLGAPSLTFTPAISNVKDPGESGAPQWRAAVNWGGRVVGWLSAQQVPTRLDALAHVLPLVGLAQQQREELQRATKLVKDSRNVASRALDFTEFFTSMLRAIDAREVEQVGTQAFASLMKTDAGLLQREGKYWLLKVPAHDLRFPIEGAEQSVFAAVLSGASTELDVELNPVGDELECALASWDYRYAYAQPLRSGDTTNGLIISLSKEHRAHSTVARAAATQVARLISITLDRFEHQRSMEERQRALEDALRIARLGTWEWSLATDEVTWSPELHRMYGGPFEPFTQSAADAAARLTPESQDVQREHVRALLLHGESQEWTAETRSLDGRTMWARSSCELVRDADGRVLHISGVTCDVTVEVSSQREREREHARAARYERLFSMSDTLSAVCSSKGIIEEVSPSWTRQLGYTRDELLGVNVGSFAPPEDVARIIEAWNGVGTMGSEIIRLKSRSGEWRWLSWTAVTDGAHLYAVASDITSLQETSQRLKDSEAQLQQAGALARIGGWSFDQLSDAFAWTAETRRLYEVPDWFTPKKGDLDKFYSPSVAAKLRDAVAESFATGKPFDLELEVITWSGRRIFARHWATVEQNGPGRKIIGAFQDVTEQRATREAALAASRAKSQFLANTSHEVRTPLNGILGMTRLALDTQLTAEQREYLEVVRTSGENLLAIVNDILDISKIESGKLEVALAPFSLKQVVFDAARNQALRAHERDLELVLDIDTEVADQHLGDAIRVSQVATNLIGNAVKFTEHGQVLVELKQQPGTIELAITDTGIGIPADRINTIFEAFTQADGSTNRRFGGTGLGLTITLELVKRMGGTIDVESTPGKGSCFRVKLPLEPVENARHLSVRRGMAMVVSDQPASRTATARQLMQLGFDVTETRSTEAIARLLELAEPAKLVVIEQELERSSGLELSEALHQEVSLRDVPRILLTRATSRPTNAELSASGIRRTFTRPVSMTELSHAVAQFEQGVSEEPSLERSTTSRREKRQLKVLIAEDNRINARLVQRICERLGHRAVHVVNGALAVAAVSREHWDAVLMDMQMPVMDGIEATRTIRAFEASRNAHTRHVPIIALTASAMSGDADMCLAAGMDVYLTKPLAPEKLVALLDRLAQDEMPALDQTA